MNFIKNKILAVVSNLYGKLKNSDGGASCICKRPAQLFLWLVISAIVSFIFILPSCYDCIKTYSNVWNQFNEGRDQRWTDTTSEFGHEFVSESESASSTWFFGTSDTDRVMTSNTDTGSDTLMSETRILVWTRTWLRTCVSAHLWSWHQNFRSCIQSQINMKRYYTWTKNIYFRY